MDSNGILMNCAEYLSVFCVAHSRKRCITQALRFANIARQYYIDLPLSGCYGVH